MADCVHKAFKEVTTSGSSRVSPPPAVVIAVCSTLTLEGGSCIATFSSKNTVDSITPEALTKLCQDPKSLDKLGCLKHARSHRPAKGSSKAAITVDEVAICLSSPGGVHSAQVIKFESTADHPRQVMTGKSFSLELQLYNQWGEKMSGATGNGIRAMASINSNNEQGAVMWGVRSNTSINGVVTLSSLVVSQPGHVDLKITTTVPAGASTPSGDKETDSGSAGKTNANVDGSGHSSMKKTLSTSKLTVYENPQMKNSNMCLFVFEDALCPAVQSDAEVSDWENTFPNEVGVLPMKQLMMALVCSDVFASWAVQLFVLPEWSGYIQVQVRTQADGQLPLCCCCRTIFSMCCMNVSMH